MEVLSYIYFFTDETIDFCFSKEMIKFKIKPQTLHIYNITLYVSRYLNNFLYLNLISMINKFHIYDISEEIKIALNTIINSRDVWHRALRQFAGTFSTLIK